MTLTTRVDLQPSQRPVGGLLAAARPITGEWWRGIQFSSPSCIAPQTFAQCPAEPFQKTFEGPSTIQTFEAFGVLQAVECSTMGGTNVQALAEQNIEVTREFAVAAELMSGAASSNPHISQASGTDLGTATDAVHALGCLDQAAAQALSGRLAYIHASPAIGNAWLAAGAIVRDGRRWLTALGSIVVISAGYDGRAPGGGAPVGGETLYAYATGEVYAEVGQRESFDAVDREVNTRQGISEELAVAAFDPCFIAGIDTTVEMCTVAS